MITLKKKNWYSLIICVCLFLSCNSNKLKYESNWLINTFEVNNVDYLDSILMYNFEINTKLMSAMPPPMKLNNKRDKIKIVGIQIQKFESKDFITFENHHFFKGKYEMNCQDELCCKLLLTNDSTVIELAYNGDLPYGISRNCKNN